MSTSTTLWYKSIVMKKFEKFCAEYNLTYDFKQLSNTQYYHSETEKAYIIFKYSERQVK